MMRRSHVVHAWPDRIDLGAEQRGSVGQIVLHEVRARGERGGDAVLRELQKLLAIARHGLVLDAPEGVS
jgi:hypothetical protein